MVHHPSSDPTVASRAPRCTHSLFGSKPSQVDATRTQDRNTQSLTQALQRWSRVLYPVPRLPKAHFSPPQTGNTKPHHTSSLISISTSDLSLVQNAFCH